MYLSTTSNSYNFSITYPNIETQTNKKTSNLKNYFKCQKNDLKDILSLEMDNNTTIPNLDVRKTISGWDP